MPNVSAGVAVLTSLFLSLAKDRSLHPGVSRQTGTINKVPSASLLTYLLLLHHLQTQQLPSFLSPEIMPRGLLWLGFSLLGALQIQAQDTTPNLIPAPSLFSIPLQPNFQDDQVGKGPGGAAGRVGAEGRRGKES